MVRSVKISDFIYTMQTYLQQKSGKPNSLDKCKPWKVEGFHFHIQEIFHFHFCTPFDESNLNRSKLIE